MIGLLTTFVLAGGVFLETALTINPAQPVEGQTLTISYNSKAEDAHLLDPQDPVLMYTIQLQDTALTDAVPMAGIGGVWSHRLRVPEGAYFIRFKLEDSLGRAVDVDDRWYNLPVIDSEGMALPGGHLSAGYALSLLGIPDYLGALTHFQRELEIYPWNWRGRKGLWDLQLGSAESEETEKKSVLAEVDSLLHAATDSLSLLHETVMMLYADLSETARAEDLLREVLRNPPRKQRLDRIVKAFFFSLLSDPEAMIDVAEELLLQLRGEEQEIVMYGYYFALNLAFQVDKAREVADRFVSRYPSSDKMPIMAYRYIQSTTQHGTSDNAEALQNYISEYPASPLVAPASASLARFYAPSDWAKAREYYELAMRADSSHPYSYNQFAYDCAVRGVDLSDAESAILKAIDMSSHNYYRRRLSHLSFEQRKESMEKDRAAFYDTYGWIKFRLEKYDDALILIEKAVKLVGEENAGAEILGHLAQTYDRLGKSDSALNVYLRLLHSDPQNEEIKENGLRIFIAQGGSEEKFDSLVNATAPVPKERGTPAPDFTVMALDDREVRLSDFVDRAVVVVNFWATWCGPCRKEIPLLNALTDRFRGNAKVVFLAISSEEKKRLEAFTKANEFKYEVCYEGKEASRAYGVVYIPTHVIIDLEGRVYSKHVGFAEGIDQTLESDIRGALRQR